MDRFVVRMMTNNIWLWDKIAPNYESTIPLESEIFLNQLQADSSIVDLGCGYGRVTNYIYSKGYHNIIGLDVSKNMLSRARASHPFITFSQGNINKLPFEDSLFDGALMIGVLSSVPDLSHRIRAISEIVRILKSGGVFLFRDFGITLKFPYFLRYLIYLFGTGKVIRRFQWGNFKSREGLIFHHFSEKELKMLFSILQPIYFKRYRYTTIHGNTINGFDVVLRKIG